MVNNKNKPKILLRWVLMLSVLGVVAIVVAGGLTLQDQIRHRKIETYLEEGNALLKEGQLGEAVAKFEIYLRSNSDNIEALAGYAELRARVIEPDNKHLDKAIDAHQQILSIDPNRMKSVMHLLDLYDLAGMSTEAIQHADFILNMDSMNQRARFVKARQLAALRRFNEAIDELDIQSEQEPLDLDANRLRLAIMLDRGDRIAQMVDWAQGLMDRYPGEPYAAISKALALSLGTDSERRDAESIIDTIDLTESSGQALWEVLIDLNDRLGRFDVSMELVRDGATRLGFDAFKPVLIKRFWDAQEIEAIADLFAGEDPWDHEQVADYLHLVGWSYLEAKQHGKYKELVSSRREKTRSRYELIWYDLLDVLALSNGEVDDNRFDLAKKSIKEGLDLFPRDPYFNYWAGRAEASRGKYHQALSHWRQAIVGARAWIVPYILTINTQIKTDQVSQAYDLAAQLYSQRDQSAAMAITYLQSAQANIDNLESEHFLFVAELVEAVQDQIELPGLVALQAEVLLRQNETKEAVEVIQKWLLKPESLDLQVVINLARISDKYDLGLDQKILEMSENAFGVTPRMTLYQSLKIAERNTPEDALVFFDRKHGQASSEAKFWRINRAQLIERIFASQALESWSELVESYPDDLSVLKSALQAESVWSEIEHASKNVERLEAIVGEDDYDYKLASARLILMRADDLPVHQRDRVLGEAVVLLAALTREYSYLLVPQLLMAQCQDRLGNAGMAAQYYGNAFEIDSNRVDLLTSQASALIRSGELNVAYLLLRDSESLFSLNPNALLVLAEWWREAGETKDMARCIEKASVLMPENRTLRLQEINLMLQRGAVDDASAELLELLETPDVDTILLALRIFGKLGKNDEINIASLAIEKLPKTVTEAKVAWLKAESLWRLGSREEAQDLFVIACSDESFANVSARSWLLLCLEGADTERLFSTMDFLATNEHIDGGLAILVNDRDLIESALVGETRGVLKEAIRGSLDQIVVREIFEEIARVIDRKATWKDILPSLAAASERYMSSVSLSGLHITGLIRSGFLSKASDIASEASRDFPNHVGIDLLHLTARTGLRDWPTVANIGKKLSSKGGNSSQVGAVSAAKAYLRMGDGIQAREMVERLATRSQIETGKFPELASMWIAAGYLRGQSPDQFKKLLDILFLESDSRSVLLNILIVTQPSRSVDMIEIWLDNFDTRLNDGDASDRMLLAIWSRAAWDKQRNESLASRSEKYLIPLVDKEEQTESAALLLGQMYEANGDLNEASKYYAKVLDKNPDNLVAINNYSMVRSVMGDHVAALKLARRAHELAPNAAFVLDTLALVALASQDFVTAENAIEKAIELSPQTAEWRITACRIYLAADKLIKAQNEIMVLKKLNNDISLTSEDRNEIQLLESALKDKKSLPGL